MPLYDFECAGCGVSRELLVSVGEAAEVRCDACGGEVRRVVPRSVWFVWGVGYSPDNDESRAMAQAFIDDPATKARVASGELREVGPSERRRRAE